jgi:4-phytase/acid phosphatase
MKRWYFSAALELVIVLSRHGIRSPLASPAQLAQHSAQPWTKWPVKPGILTEKGGRQMTKMGVYLREHYVQAGLLSGQADQDAPVVEFRSDSDQRTIASAEKLAEGVLPGTRVKVEHRMVGAADPLFTPVQMDLGHPDRALAKAAILGRIGNSPQAVFEAHRAQYALLQHVMFGAAPVAAGKLAPLTELPGLGPGTHSNLADLAGPLQEGLVLTDALLLEYEEGFPMNQVGWGRVSRADLTELLVVHGLVFDLTQKTFYCAQAQGSNLARHLRETLDQAAGGQPVDGAIGPAKQKLVVLLGHDTNQINLAGLLHVSWTFPGAQDNPVLPGGALVLELRRGDDGVHRVRLYYVSQTLDQLRNGDPVDAAHPPMVVPIFIPGCSAGTPGYDAPLSAFDARIEAAVDPQFVVPGSS